MIEFLKDEHIYVVDGIVVPSVTQIISRILYDQYTDAPQKVLKKKAEYGTKIHEWVERYSTTGERLRQSEMMKLSTDQYMTMAFEERIIIQSVEQMIACGSRYAGTYDMYGTWKGSLTLFDIKTTAGLNEEYLAWQLGMYKMAMDQPVEKCACIWLPKGDLAKLVEITPKTEEEIIDKLNEIKVQDEVNLEELPF